MKTLSAILCLLLASTTAHAGTVVCSGTVTYLSFHANNQFMIQLSSMNAPVYFCNPEQNWVIGSYVTGPQTCKMLYATFLAAKMSGSTLAGMYFDGDEVPSTCNTWGSWKNASIRHYYLSD